MAHGRWNLWSVIPRPRHTRLPVVTPSPASEGPGLCGQISSCSCETIVLCSRFNPTIALLLGWTPSVSTLFVLLFIRCRGLRMNLIIWRKAASRPRSSVFCSFEPLLLPSAPPPPPSSVVHITYLLNLPDDVAHWMPTHRLFFSLFGKYTMFPNW